MRTDVQLRLATAAIVLALVATLLVNVGGAMQHAFSHLALAGVGLIAGALDAIAFVIGAVPRDERGVPRLPRVIAAGYGGFLLLFLAFIALRLSGMPALGVLALHLAAAALLALLVVLALWLLIDQERRRS